MIKKYFKTIVIASIGLMTMSSCHSTKETYRISDSKRHYTENNRNNRPSKSTRSESKPSKNQTIDKHDIRLAVVKEAYKYIGIPYQYGGKKPQTGFDCSGFLRYVYNQNGVPVEGTSKMMAKLGKKKSLKDAQEGDLAFFGFNGKVSHVALVVENNSNELYVIHSTSKAGVRVDEINSSSYWKPKYLFSRSILN